MRQVSEEITLQLQQCGYNGTVCGMPIGPTGDGGVIAMSRMSGPLYEEVVEWLGTAHGIWIVVSPILKTHNSMQPNYWHLRISIDGSTKAVHWSGSRESALDHGIRQALKHLKETRQMPMMVESTAPMEEIGTAINLFRDNQPNLLYYANL